MLELLLFAALAFPLAWLVSEMHKYRWLSVLLGTCAITLCSIVSYGMGRIPLVFQLNTEFTGSSRKLIDAIVTQLENGNCDRVLSDLQDLQPNVYENYEDYPRYAEVVDKFVARLEDSENPRAKE